MVCMFQHNRHFHYYPCSFINCISIEFDLVLMLFYNLSIDFIWYWFDDILILVVLVLVWHFSYIIFIDIGLTCS